MHSLKTTTATTKTKTRKTDWLSDLRHTSFKKSRDLAATFTSTSNGFQRQPTTPKRKKTKITVCTNTKPVSWECDLLANAEFKFIQHHAVEQGLAKPWSKIDMNISAE